MGDKIINNCSVHPISNMTEYNRLIEIENRVIGLCEISEFIIDDDPLFIKLRELQASIFEARLKFDTERHSKMI